MPVLTSETMEINFHDFTCLKISKTSLLIYSIIYFVRITYKSVKQIGITFWCHLVLKLTELLTYPTSLKWVYRLQEKEYVRALR